MLLYGIFSILIIGIFGCVFLFENRKRREGTHDPYLLNESQHPTKNHLCFRNRIRISHYITHYKCMACGYVCNDRMKYCPECAKQEKKEHLVAFTKNHQEYLPSFFG